MEGQTPPTSPTTTHHFEATCNQVRKQWLAREKQEKLSYHLKLWDLHTEPVHLGMWFPDIPGLAENNDLDSLVVDYLHYVTTQLQQATPTAGIRYVKGFIASRDAIQTETAETMRQRIIREFSTTFFLGKTSGNPPKRGVLDEAEIIPKPVAIPVKKRPFQMVGERGAAWVNLSDQTLAEGKTEPGQRPWSSHSQLSSPQETAWACCRLQQNQRCHSGACTAIAKDWGHPAEKRKIPDLECPGHESWLSPDS